MADGTGPLPNRKDMSVSDKVGFLPIQVAPQRFFNVFVLFLLGTKAFFIFGGKYYETMANFKMNQT